ncbi:MAG TPA: hypothetical protein VIG71_03565 [Enteractinococcus sp.]
MSSWQKSRPGARGLVADRRDSITTRDADLDTGTNKASAISAGFSAS